MAIDQRKFKIVVIKSMYDLLLTESTQSHLARSLFPKVMSLKIAGYTKEYPLGVLPFDASDFVADHILLCIEENGFFEPIMGMKSVTLAKCDFHRINFPIFGMISGENCSPDHLQAVAEIVEFHRQEDGGTNLGYNGSFTIQPHLRTKENMAIFWDIIVTMIVHQYKSNNIGHVIATCAAKYKIDLRKKELGWEYLSRHGRQLPTINSYALHGGEFYIMHQQHFSQEGLKHASKYLHLWED